MSVFRRHRRWTAWVSVWLLVLSACLPTVTQALVQGDGAPPWLEVCASTGMVRVSTQDDANGSPVGVLGGAACEWCTLHGGSAGLPPASDAAPALLPRHADGSTGHPRHADIAAVWLPAQSRAPPRSD